VLAGLSVRQFLIGQDSVPVLHPRDPLDKIIERLSTTPFQSLPVTEEDGRFLGVVTLSEIHLAGQSPNLRSMVIAADLMRSDVTPLEADCSLDRALELFVENDLLALPVVDGSAQRRVIGIVKRADISSTYLRHVQGASVTGDGADYNV
jgi:CBS domain-containing protein